jgi:hypothetical protein
VPRPTAVIGRYKTLLSGEAKHYLEPIFHYLFLVENAKCGLDIKYKSSSIHNNCFNEGLKLSSGQVFNTQFMGVDRGTVPGFPFIVEISKVKREKIKFRGVLHEKRQGCFESVPMVDG